MKVARPQSMSQLLPLISMTQTNNFSDIFALAKMNHTTIARRMIIKKASLKIMKLPEFCRPF